ncbi:alanine racemase [Striga asiatica]|uniref:Alanine racemase n=1 Tax=Striga asiatica TaxID=4170 RepID=A0A5A7Q7M2_STRAF|nr:alanine racemase [Striga asiatica]
MRARTEAHVLLALGARRDEHGRWRCTSRHSGLVSRAGGIACHDWLPHGCVRLGTGGVPAATTIFRRLSAALDGGVRRSNTAAICNHSNILIYSANTDYERKAFAVDWSLDGEKVASGG